MLQDGDRFCGRGLRPGLQECVDVGQILVRNHLFGVRRHLRQRVADIGQYERERQRIGGQPRTVQSSALRLAPMAFVAAIFGEKFFSVLGVCSWRSLALEEVFSDCALARIPIDQEHGRKNEPSHAARRAA